jgi:glycosyltransferase involved in cell wall biosynthesis
MRFSIVIATYNRAASLRQTLLSLRHQTYPDFEVIVVNCPSTDGTDAVLAEFADHIRVFRCDVVSSTISRNIGLAHSSGDIVAFIDDDAIPTPTWLRELADAYREPNVGAVGGLVYDNSGVHLQYRFAACHRDGTPLFHVDPPYDQYLRPMADPVAYLQGTNMSCPRAVLQEIGGFDENIVHYHDDVELCVQVIDHGYKLKCLDGAAVHHKFLPSYARNNKRVTVDPFSQLSGRIYFALRFGRGTRTTRELIDVILAEADRLRTEADEHTKRGDMTAEQRDFHHRRVEEALELGLSQGLSGPRNGRNLPDARPEAFRPYPVVAPSGPRMKLCFVSRDYPPGDFGGPGRYTQELAAGFAAAGHEPHVVTRSPDIHRLDFEEGVWVHRVPAADRFVPELDGVAASAHIFNTVGVYHELCRIQAEGPIDLVSAPLWLCEGLVSSFDDRFPTTTTLITGMKAVAKMAKWAKEAPECQQLAALEDELIAQSQYLHAVSAPILAGAVEDYHADPARAFVANLGIRDRVHQYQRRRPASGRVRVLYVGRVETRKGADLFLDAAVRLCREFPHVEFVLAGKDIPTDDGDTHRQRFEAAFANDADVRSRVIFAGMVPEDVLYQNYADADVVCLPSRYESFGLVFVEAMVFGKPVVGARAGGMVEVVADGEQGYLVTPGDADALADALRQLVADAGLRERFGRRSRELYEERFSVPVTVGQCERHFRAVIGRHRARSGWGAKAPPPRERVGRLLADTLARAVGIAPDRARAAAEMLLDPTHHPIDFPRHFQKCWHLPAAEFAVVAYNVLLGRQPRPDEIQFWVDRVAQGNTRRIDIVRLFAETFEARRRGVTTDWIGRLEWACGGGDFFPPPAAGPAAPPASEQPAPAPAAPARRSLRARFSEMGRVGKLFKYARRAVYLPWNFHKFYHEFANGAPVARAVADQREALEATVRGETQQVLQAIRSLQEMRELLPLLRQLMARQEGFRELLWKKESAIAAGQDELRALLNDQIAQVSDSLTGIVGVVEFPPGAVADRAGELPDVARPSLHQHRQAG